MNFLLRPLTTGIVMLFLLTALAACSDKDHLDTVPRDCTALASVDIQEAASYGLTDVLQDILGTSDISESGIDLTARLYVFATAGGDFGLTAGIADRGDFDVWIDKAVASGLCRKPSEYKDFSFTLFNGAWLMGYSADVVMAIGPVLPAQMQEVRLRMAKYLAQDADDGVRQTPLFARLDSIGGAISVVASAAALPESMAAPATIGAPKDADPSQIMIAAGMEKGGDGCLIVRGETFSFNPKVDAELKSSREILRPITGEIIRNMSADDALGVSANVDGSRFITLLHANKGISTLLAGVNMAVDMNKIIRSIDGDVLFAMPSAAAGDASLRLCARLGSKSFLDDVDYWKQSCPAGTRLFDCGKDFYGFTYDDHTYYFGVSSDMRFYAADTQDAALQTLQKAVRPLPETVLSAIEGQRLAVVINLDALAKGSGAAAGYIGKLAGNARTVVYLMK